MGEVYLGEKRKKIEEVKEDKGSGVSYFIKDIDCNGVSKRKGRKGQKKKENKFKKNRTLCGSVECKNILLFTNDFIHSLF